MPYSIIDSLAFLEQSLLRRLEVWFAVVGLAFASMARGQVTSLEIVSRPAPADVLPGYVVNDLLIDFTGRYIGSQMIVELARGSIYQNELQSVIGRFMPPHAFLIDFVPAVEWDTFLANGGPTVEETIGTIGLGGVVVDGNGPSGVRRFDTEAIDIEWFPSPTNEILDRSGFMVARVTLSHDAAGTFRYLASANGALGIAGAPEVALPVTRGVIGAVPEPSGVILLCVGSAGIWVFGRVLSTK